MPVDRTQEILLSRDVETGLLVVALLDENDTSHLETETPEEHAQHLGRGFIDLTETK